MGESGAAGEATLVRTHGTADARREVVAGMHAQDAERELQREGLSVGCVRSDGDGACSDGGEAGRAFEGDDGGDMGGEGVDGVEHGASMAAREAEGSDEGEVMAGKENISMQRAEGGGGSTGGIKKKKPQRRSKGAKNHKQERQM